MEELQKLESLGDYPELIARVRELVAKDPRRFESPFIQAWCGRRWRHLFLTAAVADDRALAAATRNRPWRADRRSERQRIAERFLTTDDHEAWRDELPPAGELRPSSTTLLFCPGLLNGLLPVRAFEDAFPALEAEHGWRVLRADSNPLRGCEANAGDLERALDEGVGLGADGSPIEPEGAQPLGDCLLLAYSKGMPDLLTLLARRPDLGSRVRAVFSWAGAIGGSYLADDTYQKMRRLKLERAEAKGQKIFRPFLRDFLPRLDLGTVFNHLPEIDLGDSVKDLTTTERRRFLEQHEAGLDALGIPIFTIAAVTSAAEVPYFQRRAFQQIHHLEGPNDMQLSISQAGLGLPMAVPLGLVRGHHWDIAYPPFPKPLRGFSRKLGHPFPKGAAVRAMVQLAAELGLVD